MLPSDRVIPRRLLLGVLLACVVTGTAWYAGGPTSIVADDGDPHDLTTARADARHRSLPTVDAPAQTTATAVPTFAPCPTPATPLPPGLWPIPRYDGVRAVWINDGEDAPQLALEVCVRNDGPGTWGPMTIALQGCVAEPVRIRALAIEEFHRRCYRLPFGGRTDAPCQIMYDADCENQTPFDIDRRWTGSVEIPPSPTPDPPVTHTATAEGTPTVEGTSVPPRTASPSATNPSGSPTAATDLSPVHLPRVERGPSR